MRIPNIIARGVVIYSIILSIFLQPRTAIVRAYIDGKPQRSASWGLRPASEGPAQATPGAPTIPPKTYLPWVSTGADIQLTSAWVGDAGGSKSAFLPGDSIRYVASGTNLSSFAGVVTLTWSQTNACGTGVIYTTTLTLQPGGWEQVYSTTVPDCQGIYTTTVAITNLDRSSSLFTWFAVFPPSAAIIGNGQAFDKCALPRVEQMQTWWNNSPYSVFNIYLGGISFACSSNPLDPLWLSIVSQQGWSFIPTWVGLQAPCSGYNYRMSSDSATAYQQGRGEADLAAAAAARLGLLGGKVIYYDVESYSGASSACRATVASFLRGWVQRLHELGIRAGAYGTPCTSYISDWAAMPPAPDDIWIAHWYKTSYDVNASVFTVPCLSDSLWPNHQRLKQYAGDHVETWGGLSQTIDSNVLDGEITALPAPPASLAEPSMPSTETLVSPQIRDMHLLSPQAGWALVEDRLLWTRDAGLTWQDITPSSGTPAELLAVTFLDLQQGWVVQRTNQEGQLEALALLHTRDGGATWEASPLPVSASGDAHPVEAAHLDFLNSSTGWAALKLQTGSSFSLGRLFLTQDGGRTWQERSIPLGEPVRFVDASRGWVAGGPSGELLYRTVDGGLTWQSQSVLLLGATPSTGAWVGLPAFVNERDGVLPVTLGSGFALFATHDGGDSWGLATRLDLAPGDEPGSPLPFSLGAGGRWWAGSPGEARLYTALDASKSVTRLSPASLPVGIVALDFFDDRVGWALAQEGSCQGYKAPSGLAAPPGAEPFRCALSSHLIMTSDGGGTWREVTPPL